MKRNNVNKVLMIGLLMFSTVNILNNIFKHDIHFKDLLLGISFGVILASFFIKKNATNLKAWKNGFKK